MQKVHSAQEMAFSTIPSTSHILKDFAHKESCFVFCGLPCPTLPSINAHLHKLSEQRTTLSRTTGRVPFSLKGGILFYILQNLSQTHIGFFPPSFFQLRKHVTMPMCFDHQYKNLFIISVLLRAIRL